jgi:glycosyltransferase involved in cell wall biosynthesis
MTAALEGAGAAVAESDLAQGASEAVPGRRRVCMFVYNAFVSDVRVLKEASSLVAAGHEVHLVAVLDKRTVPREEHPAGFTIVRIDRNPPHYRLLRRTRLARRWLRLRRARARRWARRHLGTGRRVRRLINPVRRPALESAGLSARTGEAMSSRTRFPARVYRAARWRAMRRVPALRRMYYRRRVRRARALAERGSGRRPSTLRAAATWGAATSGAATSKALVVLAAPLAAPVFIARGLGRAGAWVDRRVSHLGYRTVMVFHKPLMFTDYYRRAYRLARDEGFDTFHAHDLNTLPVAAWLARRTGGRLIYDAHELYTEISTLSRLERFVWRRVERLLIKRADHIITVCESIAGELSDRYRVPGPLVLLNCPPGRESTAFAGPNRLRLKAGLIDSEEPIVLYQGGFSPNRGIEQLVDAACFLDRGVVLLMGWGNIEDALARRIRENNLEGRVVIIGPAAQHELVEFTAGADVGVIPYRPVGLNNYYTTPNKLFDYIVAGVAVVGSKLPEIQRFVEGPGLGITFDPDVPKDIARAINYVLEDPARLAEMKANARAAAPLYVWENEAVKLLELYAR